MECNEKNVLRFSYLFTRLYMELPHGDAILWYVHSKCYTSYLDKL